MPPALEDDVSSAGEEEIPYREKGFADPVDDEEDEGDEEEAEVYVVERILSHKISRGKTVYKVKWQGYDDEADMTWEPEENLEGAIDVLNEYLDSIGGRSELGGAKKGTKRGRKSAAAESEAATPATTKRAKKEKEWSPPPGSWEPEVDYIDTVMENIDAKTGEPQKYALLVWHNQKKTQHPLQHVYAKCPQKMLQYYESHLVFTPPGPPSTDDDLNGTKDVYTKDEY
ncbi:chromo-domain-containing protein [Sporormia fimetaria CBS 119925]|uniref:Chromo-domain-containing protein n=1 Tax=Sporormia fimetaria CBS 119925 TaxID=1340428 RepID=A0A6A6UUB4_9PLEO|nr:chromo-domain-containing protein [Sporormia fimetaria CBS 119925]